MKRLVASALFVIGCGNGGGGGTTMQDLKVPADLAMAPEPDLAISGAGTGQPCQAAADCAPIPATGKGANCITKTAGPNMTSIDWPQGYCSAKSCNPKMNDATDGSNTGCYGDDLATCANLLGDGNQCAVLCDETIPCRTGYGCFDVAYTEDGTSISACIPRKYSQCNPQKAKSCPAPTMKPDGGVAYNDACFWEGPLYDVGSCAPGCDPWATDRAKNGCPGEVDMEDYTDCHIQVINGDGYCTIKTDGKTAGSDCEYLDDCPTGYGCYFAKPSDMMGKCYRYCNTANAAMNCSQGALCKSFPGAYGFTFPAVPGGVGVCSKSN